MGSTNWHVVAYDIRCPRRLRRVHRQMASEGLALQQSVFLVQGGRRRLAAVLDRVATSMDPEVDDLRSYPVGHPASLWLGGVSAVTQEEPAAEAGLTAQCVESIRRWVADLRRMA